MIGDETDFLIERRLAKLNPKLHDLYKSGVFGVQTLLTNYQNIFPEYTEHSFIHSEQIINFCNKLIGLENIEKLNEDELYILLMGILLHDVGMGISDRDLKEFAAKNPAYSLFLHEHKDAGHATLVRNFHHEISGFFINKYKDFFDIPSDEYAFCITQVARGHRRVDLLDSEEYSSTYRLANGNTVCLPYLSALIRLGDELDIGADRSPFFFYDPNDPELPEIEVWIYRSHEVIKTLDITENSFRFIIEQAEPEVFAIVKETITKLKEVLSYCVRVIEDRTPFTIKQKSVEYFVQNNSEQ